MRKKSIVSLLLSLLLALSFITLPCVSAANSPSITVSNTAAKPGDTVTLELSLSNNPGICTMRLFLHYSKGLTLTGAKDTDLLHDSVFSNDYAQTPFILYWDDSLASADNTSNGVIAKLTFQVADTAANGSYRVWVTYDEGDIFNLELTSQSFATVEGTINVSGSTTQPTSESTPPTSESAQPTQPAPAESESGSEPTTIEPSGNPKPDDPNSPYTGNPVTPTSESPIVPTSGELQAAPDNTLLIILVAVLLAVLVGALIVILVLRRKRKK